MLKLLSFVLSLFLLTPLGAEQEGSLVAQADAAYAQRSDVPQAKIALTLYQRAAATVSSATGVECQ